ncbi:MAG: dTDP-4-dehydrorhamnose reductase [Deltaproteobacteria bacterium]|nr:dTDP-4-dehydrorhamnose reductase [Deltaproteobacteria bacterium]
MHHKKKFEKGFGEHRILLIGASGMLGRAFVKELSERNTHFIPGLRPDFDLLKDRCFELIEKLRPQLILNCAAYTDVNGAEAHEQLAFAVNAYAVRRLAELARRIGAFLVNFGTDYVFDGRSQAPYRVDAPIAPGNAYARSKALGERWLLRSGCEALQVRTSWLYAPWGKNFVRTIATRAMEGARLRVVNDQRGRPTSAEHLARTTLALIERNAQGIFHVCDGGECTWFELAQAVVRGLGLEGHVRVEPCTSAEWPSPARRPAYSVLDLSETEALLGPMPHWTTNLAHVLSRLEA